MADSATAKLITLQSSLFFSNVDNNDAEWKVTSGLSFLRSSFEQKCTVQEANTPSLSRAIFDLCLKVEVSSGERTRTKPFRLISTSMTSLVKMNLV